MKKHLKAWNDSAWQRRLTKTLTVSRVDEDIPASTLKEKRKPWYIVLTQKPELNAHVDGIPDGTSLLLTEDDVVELVRYLLESQTALWVENPEAQAAGIYKAIAFVQPGMVALTDIDEVVNGEENWSPDYFKELALAGKALTPDPWTEKIHTLPWKLPNIKEK